VPWLPPGVPLLWLVFDPEHFWARIRSVAETAPERAATFQLLGKTGILMLDRALIRGTTRDGGKVFKIFAHPNARWLFYTSTQQNLIVLPNDVHATVRAQYQTFLAMDPLKQHLGARLHAAQRAWIAATMAGVADADDDDDDQGRRKTMVVDVRVWSQGLLAHTILTNICPKYFLEKDDAARAKACEDVRTFTMGFLSLPIPFRPFGLGRAIAAGERIIADLTSWMREIRATFPCAVCEDAKDASETAKVVDETRLLAEFGFLGRWMVELEKNFSGPSKTKVRFTDRDVAVNMLDMAFAAQDATNSAVCFAVAYLASHPEALTRLRGQPYDAKDVEHFCVNILSAKPPVPMTLRIATKDATLRTSGGHSVAAQRGDLVVHSIEGINKVWEKAADFDFMDDIFAEPSDPGFVDSLVFGSGAHKCPGKSYAIISLQTFVAALADEVDAIEPVEYDPHLMYYPTLFPTKSTFLFRKRSAPQDGATRTPAVAEDKQLPEPPDDLPPPKVGNVALGTRL